MKLGRVYPISIDSRKVSNLISILNHAFVKTVGDGPFQGVPKQQLQEIDVEDDQAEFPDFKGEYELPSGTFLPNLDEIVLEGSPSFRAALKKLCNEFADIFHKLVQPEPSKFLEPMDLRVAQRHMALLLDNFLDLWF